MAEQIESLVQDELERLAECRGRALGRGDLATGIAPLDHALGGLRRGEIVVLAGRRFMGHRELGLGIALHAAVEQGATTGILAGTCGARAVVQRLLANLAGLDSRTLLDGSADEAQQVLLTRAAERLTQAHLWITDAPRPTMEELVDICCAVQPPEPEGAPPQPPGLLLIDGLHLFASADLDVAPNQRLTAVLEHVRNWLPADHHFCVVATLDLPGSGTRCPQFEDVRRLGLSEDDPDTLVFVHRNITGGAAADRDRLELDVVSQRHGPPCNLPLTYRWNTGQVTARAPEG